VVRVLAWFAIAAAFSSVPLFFKYAVIPVARNEWLPTFVAELRRQAKSPIAVSHWRSHADTIRDKIRDKRLTNGEKDAILSGLRRERRGGRPGKSRFQIFSAATP
jgi:hypothetical protein